MRRITAVAVAGALTMGSTAAAQSSGDVAAYIALSLTPVGALPVMARATMFDAEPAPASFNARYGTQDDVHTFGAGADFRVGGSGRTALTLGYLTCDGCDGVFMLGADYIRPIVRSAIATGATPATLTVSLNPSLGYARPSDGEVTALAASVGVPVAVGMGDAGSRVAAFVAPGIGFGSLSGSGESESGVRPMLGGGLGVRLGQATLSASVQKVFFEFGEIQYGLGIALGR